MALLRHEALPRRLGCHYRGRIGESTGVPNVYGVRGNGDLRQVIAYQSLTSSLLRDQRKSNAGHPPMRGGRKEAE